MAQSFFITDAAKWEERQREIEEREALHDKLSRERAAYAVSLRDAADEDQHAARIIALSRLMRPGDWGSHDNFKQYASDQRRRNTPEATKLARMHDRTADICIVPAVDLAERVLALVGSWGDDTP